jgi:hypothetical protein
MFYKATSFNQNINIQSGTSYNAWDMSKVIRMVDMFKGATNMSEVYKPLINCEILTNFDDCKDGKNPISWEEIPETEHNINNYYKFKDTGHCVSVNNWLDMGQNHNPLTTKYTICNGGTSVISQ